MLDKYGLDREGVYDLIRDEIRESPLFRFDWFFLSRTPQEISRRCTTLITTVAKEMEGGTGKENKRAVVEDEESEEIEEPTKKKSRASTGGAKVSSILVLL
jgi:SWI/SNF-related matrix-associated actin-dependent regulator of chromatin subfamily A member 5